VTSDGGPHARFKRALKTRNPMLVTAAAHELGQISLADALAVCLVYRDRDRGKYEPAIVRWQARYCVEHRPSADEAQLVLAGLRALAGKRAGAAGRSLVVLWRSVGLVREAKVLQEWLRASEQAELR
jgi:hypothetical protein